MNNTIIVIFILIGITILTISGHAYNLQNKQYEDSSYKTKYIPNSIWSKIQNKRGVNNE